MFESLTEQLQSVFGKLGRQKKLTDENISDAVREVRLALLDADVNYGVTKKFVKRVKEAALGEKVIKSVQPGQQFIKVVHDELVQLMGNDETQLALKHKPSVLMLCGLQGSGKTTHCVKLAKHLKKQGKKVLIAACDLQRPAAIQQLRTLGEQANTAIFSSEVEKKPLKVAKLALKEAKAEKYDVLIVDTAGRLHVDTELMDELSELKKALNPEDIIFVANATTGQDAVNTAKEFHERMNISGTILTMLDGNTRGGAAISIVEVTQRPLLFEGIGEKLDDLQAFNPKSMADRILGMGDTINLVKKAQEFVDEDEAKKLEKKLRKASFTFDDYLKQMATMKKMGSMKSLLKMIPGVSKLPQLDEADKHFSVVEAIILSMTQKERLGEDELSVSRKKRIAKGSGTSMEEVNKLIKAFKQMKQFFKKMPNMKRLEQMMGGQSWQ
jgi:signal recognition particle subunit SRP54